MPDTDALLPREVSAGAVTVALVAITATEATGANMTRDQYQDLHTAVSDALTAHPELTTSAPLADLHLDLTTPNHLNLGTWVMVEQLLTAHRGNIEAPNGTHGPWPGTRCVYCGSNDLDVDLYTVDPGTCPPLWACGSRHPDRNTARQDWNDPRAYASCNLDPNHPDDHTYAHYTYPTAHDPVVESQERDDAAAWGTDIDENTVGLVTATGPPQRHLITWPR